MDPSVWSGRPRRVGRALTAVFEAWVAPPPVPVEVRARDEARQRRLFEVLAGALGTIYAIWAVVWLPAGWAVASIGLCGGALAGVIAGVRQGRWRRTVAGGWLVALLWAVLSLIVFATGGVGLSAPFALVLVPMLAALLVGPRASVGWTGVILVEVGALAALHLGGVGFAHEASPSAAHSVLGLSVVVALLAAAGIMAHLRGQALVVDLVDARDTLDRTRDRARQATAAKSRFLAGMSHELRTPMTGVLGMLDALRDEPLSVEQRETLGQAEVSAHALLLLINAIIDLASAESSALQFEAAPFDLAGLVEAHVDAARPALTARRVGIDVGVAPGTPTWVLGDAFRVGQVLGVLLDNAVEYTEAGAISVRVEGQGGAMRVVVSDTGRGIAAPQQSAIFDPFARGTVASPGGGGLGLAIGRRLARRMGGELDVTSAVGVGSVFTLSLPLEATAAPRTSLVPISEEGAARAIRGMRVLVVDDNPINRSVVERVLRQLDCGVTTADDGEAGVAAARAGRYDLVLMDVQMPGVDGLEAARRLRAAGDRTPIVALTASTAESDRAMCLAVGMDGVLHKPLRRAELIAALHARLPPG